VKVLATYSIKGGVGKTTAAVNLAHEAARTGARVLLWDLDPQGAATFFLRVEPRLAGGVEGLVGPHGALADHRHECDTPGLHLVPADFSLRLLDLELDGTGHRRRRLAELLDDVAGDYDVAVLDCPAGITLASEAVFRAADALLVPMVPAPLSMRTLDQLVEFLAARSARGRPVPAVWPFVSMFDWRKAAHRALLARLAACDPPCLSTAIPDSSAIERMGRLRQPVGAFAPRTTAGRAYAALWAEVAPRLWPS
jgi:cellulose biosynthesis protein BcsQ